MPNPTTALNALTSGEVDYWENLPSDYAPGLVHDSNITVTSRAGFIGTVRFNQLHPPFDNMKMRQAVLAVADQRDYMAAMAGDPVNWRTCPSVLRLRLGSGRTRPAARLCPGRATTTRRSG